MFHASVDDENLIVCISEHVSEVDEVSGPVQPIQSIILLVVYRRILRENDSFDADGFDERIDDGVGMRIKQMVRQYFHLGFHF